MNCPNCLTPWKCNGPHLEKIDDNHYHSSDGYYTKDQLSSWTFLPFERSFTENGLRDILDTLRNLNCKLDNKIYTINNAHNIAIDIARAIEQEKDDE